MNEFTLVISGKIISHNCNDACSWSDLINLITLYQYHRYQRTVNTRGKDELGIHIVTPSKGVTDSCKNYEGVIWPEPEKEEGQLAAPEYNPMKEWMDDEKTMWGYDPMEPKNHDMIVKHYDVENKYHFLVKKMKAEESKVLKNHIMMYCVQWARKAKKKGLAGAMCMIEGNNRGCATVLTVCQSTFDGNRNVIEWNSLTPDWLAENVGTTGDQIESLKAHLSDMNLTTLLESNYGDATQMLGKKVRIRLYYGIPRSEFKQMDISKQDVQEALVGYSALLSDHKRMSAVPPESIRMAESLLNVLKACRETSLTEGEYGTYSKDGGQYIENEPATKDDNVVKPCLVLTSVEWEKYKKQPNWANLNAFRKRWPGGVMTKNKERMISANKTTLPPFPLNDISIGRANGKYYASDRKKSKKGEKKLKHLSLAQEEMLKFMLVAAIHHSVFRCKRRIPARGWDQYPEKNICEVEIQYICENLCFTSKTDGVGTKPRKIVADDPRFEVLQLKGDTPLSLHRQDWACTLFIADMFIALICKNELDDGVASVNDFIDFIYKAHYDDTNYNDFDFVDTFGKCGIVVYFDHADHIRLNHCFFKTMQLACMLR